MHQRVEDMSLCHFHSPIKTRGLKKEGTIKVSIIVPIYNPGNRIYKCLDTLVNQTLREIEIICVLDCPTDGADKVVVEYAKKDHRIVVVRNEHNMGISSSRNEGLELAHGEYIGFSDHDDYRELNMYELLYKKASANGLDIVVSDVKLVNEDRREEKCSFGDTTKLGLANSVLLPMESVNNPNKLSRAVWHSIYRKSFIEKRKIRFESRKVYEEEDSLFNLKSFLLADSIGYCCETLYCWDKHLESESNKIYPPEEVVYRQLNSLIYIANFLKDSGYFESCKESFFIAVSSAINTYFPLYKSLVGEQRKRFVDLISGIRFPVFGYYNLKLVSYKRLKLFFFLLKVKWEGRKLKDSSADNEKESERYV